MDNEDFGQQDGDYQQAPNGMAGSDAAFLYFLFTFQFFVSVFGTVMFYFKITGTKEYQREKKVTKPKLFMQMLILIVNVFWMYHTYLLIQLDNEMKDKSFDPYTALGLALPMNVRSGFGSSAVKKAYRALARKYHPDKVGQLEEEEKAGAASKWQMIIKSYETLTDEDKYNNWITHGHPDGSLMQQSMDIAIPAWIADK